MMVYGRKLRCTEDGKCSYYEADFKDSYQAFDEMKYSF